MHLCAAAGLYPQHLLRLHNQACSQPQSEVNHDALAALQELVRAGEPFTTTDYMQATPDWAVYDAPERGFDPQETRVRKVRNHGRTGAEA